MKIGRLLAVPVVALAAGVGSTVAVSWFFAIARPPTSIRSRVDTQWDVTGAGLSVHAESYEHVGTRLYSVGVGKLILRIGQSHPEIQDVTAFIPTPFQRGALPWHCGERDLPIAAKEWENAAVRASGFPFPAIYCTYLWSGNSNPTVVHGGLPTGRQIGQGQGPTLFPEALPIYVVPSYALANFAIYSVIWMFALTAPGLVRTRFRAKSGRCTACGYRLDGLQDPRCPECGTEVSEGRFGRRMGPRLPQHCPR